MPLLIPHELRLPAGQNPNDTWLGITSLDRLLPHKLGPRANALARLGLRPACDAPVEVRRLQASRALMHREMLRRDEEARIKVVEDDLELVPAAFRQWPSRRELWWPVSCDGCDWTPAHFDALLRARMEEASLATDEAFEAAKARWSMCKGLTLWRRPLALWEQATLARDARRKDETP